MREVDLDGTQQRPVLFNLPHGRVLVGIGGNALRSGAAGRGLGRRAPRVLGRPVELRRLGVLPLAEDGRQYAAANHGQGLRRWNGAAGQGLLRLLLPLLLAALAELVALPQLCTRRLANVQAAVARNEARGQRLAAPLHVPHLFAPLAPAREVREKGLKVHKANVVLRQLRAVQDNVVLGARLDHGLRRGVELLLGEGWWGRRK